MGAVGIMGDMSKGAGQNIAGLKKRATTVADKASDRTRLANQVMDDTSADAPGRGMTESSFMGEYNKDFATADRRMVGKWVHIDGVVVLSRTVDKYTYVYVVSKDSNAKGTAYAFRFDDPNMKFADKSPASFDGVFAFTRKDDKTGKQILYFDATGQTADAGADAQSAPAQAAPKPVEPELPLAGWRFQGAVQTPEGATGVFTRDGKTLYAHEGDTLDKDWKVKKLSASEVEVSNGKKSQTAMPW